MKTRLTAFLTAGMMLLSAAASPPFIAADDAQNTLKKGEMRVTLLDYDTGEPLILEKGAQLTMWTNISIHTEHGTVSSGPIYLIETNPTVVDNLSGFFSADSFSFGLNEYNLPECYMLPETDTTPGYYNDTIIPKDHMTVTKYENGSADVVFRLIYQPSGDLSGDGKFEVSDLVLLQKWLLSAPDTQLEGWQNADFRHDNLLTAADLSKMKQKLLHSNTKGCVEPNQRLVVPNYMFVLQDGLKLYRGPDESYEVITSIPSIEIPEIGYQNGNPNWVFTEYDGKYGWVKLYQDDGTTPTVIWNKMADKPVIYLYPETETDVHVELEVTESDLSTTYPKYNGGWDVTASPDGTLCNHADGTHHRYLFWESVNCRTRFDFSKGFCVAGSDTERFLKEKLAYMGLNEDEMNEFIVYWLPRMEHNAYNLIAFQSDAYTNSAKLHITPEPDSICRIFMAFVPLEAAAEIEPQQLLPFERTGFAVVEWGGTELKP